MAGLTESNVPPPPPPQPWTTAQSQTPHRISPRVQFTALAYLRWCIFRNSFRGKGGVGELIARIIFLPIIGVFAIGPILGAGFAAYHLVSSHRVAFLPILTWVIFALTQLISINISLPALSFDITTIIRFPLSFPRYLTARLFFGLLSTSNVIGTLALLSTDIGISIARPSLAAWATLLLATFALANIFFTRMVFAWVDRWLSTRRSREIFTALIIFGSLGLQYLNVTFNPGFQNGHHHNSIAAHLPLFLKIFHYVKPVAAVLPPGLAASSIISFGRGSAPAAVAALIGLIAFALLFLAIYAWRMQREFRGENLSELSLPKRRPAAAPSTRQTKPSVGRAFSLKPGFNSILTACLEKELLYLRRNTNQLYGFIAPVFMVFIFANRVSAGGRFGSYVLPAAVAYSILGVSILAYNALGIDGSGVQLYFLAPIHMREVFLAKNLIVFLLNLIEFVLIIAVLYLTSRPPSLLILLATLCWLLFTVFINGAVGNIRSLAAPKKVDLSKISRKQTSQLSALITLGVVAACYAVGFAVVLLTNRLHRSWLMIPILLALAAVAFIFYLRALNQLDAFALDHREQLTEELCKP